MNKKTYDQDQLPPPDIAPRRWFHVDGTKLKAKFGEDAEKLIHGYQYDEKLIKVLYLSSDPNNELERPDNYWICLTSKGAGRRDKQEYSSKGKKSKEIPGFLVFTKFLNQFPHKDIPPRGTYEKEEDKIPTDYQVLDPSTDIEEEKIPLDYQVLDPTDKSILDHLHRFSKKSRMITAKIAEAIGKKDKTIAKNLSKLVKNGFLDNKGDKKGYLITDKGIQAALYFTNSN